MPTIKSRSVFIALLLLAAAPVLPQGPAGTPRVTRPVRPSDAELVAGLKTFVQAQAASGAFSGAVLLAKGDTVLYREAVGLASREKGERNTPNTRFNIGSINKVFTQVAIAHLAREGKLKLDDTLDRYVPEYPVEKGRRLTLQQLLDHRGGTGDVFGAEYDAYDHARLQRLRDWLPLIAARPLEFAPGTQQSYSNAGYVLLGLAIEAVSKMSYDDYVRDIIFTPAGMNDTTLDGVSARGLLTATGYTEGPGGRVGDNHASLPARGTSAGGGFSTVDDLLRYASALRAGRIGPRAPTTGVSIMGGGERGVNAVLQLVDDYTLVALANQDPPTAQVIASKVRSLLGESDETGPGHFIIRPPASPPAGEKPPENPIPLAGVTASPRPTPVISPPGI